MVATVVVSVRYMRERAVSLGGLKAAADVAGRA